MWVKEIVSTFQGEGRHTGTPMVLIRLGGCNGTCPWCDTSTAREDSDEELSCAQVLERCNALRGERCTSYGGTKHLLLTGGEPGLLGVHRLDGFYFAARNLGWKIHVESNGTLPLSLGRRRPDWVCISPKPLYTPPLDPVEVFRADEIKWVFGAEHPWTLSAFLAEYHVDESRITMQPLWGDKALTNECIKVCTQTGFRLSLQTHKYVNWS